MEKPRDYGTMSTFSSENAVVEREENRKPKKRTIKAFREEKERERNQSVNIRPQFIGRADSATSFI